MIPSRFSKKDPVRYKQSLGNYKTEHVSEWHHLLLIAIFFVSAFTILFYIGITLISLLDASRIFASFGLVGFIIAFLIRKKVGLSVLDGLYFNVFGAAPVAMTLYLAVNASCTDLQVEHHKVVYLDASGNGYRFELENGAYEDYWRIRTAGSDQARPSNPHVEFTFCNGVFGHRVVKNTVLY